MENDQDMEQWKAEQERLRQERRKVAEDFYNRDTSLTPEQREEQLRGINYNRDVRVGYIEKGEAVEQHQPASRQTGPHAQGTYLAPVGSSQHELGVHGEQRPNPGRERDLFVANKRTEVLHSTASDTPSWSKDPKKDGAELYYGGGEQMVCHHSDKQNFDRVIQSKQQSAGPQESAQQNSAQTQQTQNQQAEQKERAKPPVGEYEAARKQARENEQRNQAKEKAEDRTQGQEQAAKQEKQATRESLHAGKSR